MMTPWIKGSPTQIHNIKLLRQTHSRRNNHESTLYLVELLNIPQLNI